MKNRSIDYRRSLLGVAVLSIGLLTIGPSKGSPATRGLANARKVMNAAQAGTGTTPTQSRYIGKHSQYSNEPVEIKSLRINGRPTAINSHLRGNEDWLKGLSFKVKNISQKNILYLSVQLMFPQTKATGSVFAFPFTFGVKPLPSQGVPTDPLMPNQEVEFNLSDAQYEKLKRILNTSLSIPIENIRDAALNVVLVVFNDDTAWATGSFMHRDPNDPTKWVDDTN